MSRLEINQLHITGPGGLVEDRNGEIHEPQPNWGFSGGTHHRDDFWRIVAGAPSKGDAPDVPMVLVESKPLQITMVLYGKHALEVMELPRDCTFHDRIRPIFIGHLQSRTAWVDLYSLLVRIRDQAEAQGNYEGKESIRAALRQTLGL